jgi:PKD repeat protein
MFGSPNRRRVVLSLLVLALAACEREQPTTTAPVATASLMAGSGVGGAFTATGDALATRLGQVAARLPDGRILIAGGVSGSSRLASAELYDPASGTWSGTANMTFRRLGHAVAQLTDGRVLVVGGHDASISCADAPVGNSAEIYDPATAAWTLTGNLSVNRSSAVAVRLADGRVLVAGGGDRCGNVRKAAEIFDPSTGAWTRTGDMNVAREALAAVLLRDGRVLVAGGFGVSPFASLASAEVFDPATGTWTQTGSMHDPRMWTFDDMSAGGFLTLLSDGRVFTAGGLNRCGTSASCAIAYLKTAEIYDPATGVWAATGALTKGRSRHQLASLPDGRVVVAGGWDGTATVGAAEVFDPAIGAFSAAGTLVTARMDFTATSLTDGRVLAADGRSDAFTALKSTELFAVGNHPPVANAGAAATGTEGTAVSFDGSASSDPDGDALTYAWDFGDGQSGTGPAPTHVYADNGSYAVKLTVSDGTLIGIASTTATIANVAPQVSALADATLQPGQTYTADGSFTDPGADSWNATVSYGDGSATEQLALSGTTFSLSHTYPSDQAGPFTVVVTVSDDDGGVGTAQASVGVQLNRAPVANAGAAVSGSEGTAVSFDGSASSDPEGTALLYAWNFGDGSLTATGATVSHVYADNGTYTATLTVSDGSLTGSATTTATIANVAPSVGAIAGATLQPGGSYAAGGSFTDPGADSWIASVDYGDGSGTQPLALSGSTFTLGHTYAASGTFTVTVIVVDDDGESGTSHATVVVQAPSLTPQQQVAAVDNMVADMQSSGVLNPPSANSLSASLDAAIAKLDRGDVSGALNDLQVFVSKVQGLVKTGRLTQEEAQPLLDAANAIIAQLSAGQTSVRHR